MGREKFDKEWGRTALIPDGYKHGDSPVFDRTIQSEYVALVDEWSSLHPYNMNKAKVNAFAAGCLKVRVEYQVMKEALESAINLFEKFPSFVEFKNWMSKDIPDNSDACKQVVDDQIGVEQKQSVKYREDFFKVFKKASDDDLERFTRKWYISQYSEETLGLLESQGLSLNLYTQCALKDWALNGFSISEPFF